MIKVDNKNYTGRKYLLTNLRADEKAIMKAGGFLKTFAIYSPIKDTVTKVYYDTPDAYFQSIGIIININQYKGKDKAELILRYDSPTERINFLNDIPDTFIFRIDKFKKINSMYEELEDYLIQLYPTGFGTDIKDKIKALKPYLKVNKKRKRYKVVNPNGLKVIMSFEESKFYNRFNGNNSVKLDVLELRLDSDFARTIKLFQNFEHELILQDTSIIKLEHSDLFIGQEYLGIKLNLTERVGSLNTTQKSLKSIKQLKSGKTDIKSTNNNNQNKQTSKNETENTKPKKKGFFSFFKK